MPSPRGHLVASPSSDGQPGATPDRVVVGGYDEHCAGAGACHRAEPIARLLPPEGASRGRTGDIGRSGAVESLPAHAPRPRQAREAPREIAPLVVGHTIVASCAGLQTPSRTFPGSVVTRARHRGV